MAEEFFKIKSYGKLTIEDNGIHVYGGSVNNRAYSYLYMGKETRSAVCENIYRSPHKLLLLNDVSPHPRLS